MSVTEGVFKRFVQIDGSNAKKGHYCTLINIEIDGVETVVAFQGLICSSAEGRTVSCIIDKQKPERGDLLVSDIRDAETNKSYVTYR